MVLAGATTGIRRPKFVIAATGAIERPVPFPGWTLPGVMTAGAAQLLLKGAAAVPRGDVVLAGTGPLLYLVAWQLLKVGAPPKAILDSSQLANRFRALSELPGPHMLKPVLQGLRMIADLRKAGIRFHRADRIEAIGSGDLEAVVAHCGRSRITIPADVLLVHDGVIASTQFTRLAGCEHVWDARQHAHLPRVDAWGATSNSCIYVAGDCAGIDGGKAAEAKGAISALAVAEKLGRISAAERDRQAAPHRRVLSKERRLRRFLDVLYPPRLARAGLASDETVLCRCESVTVGDIRKALQLGADGPGKLKAFTRAGMGPCQGRICGPSLVNLICASSGDWGAEAMMNIRPPLKPVPLRMIAGHDQ